MVFMAVFIAISMQSLQEGVYGKMIENVVGFYTGYVQIHKDGYQDEPSIDNSFESTPVVKTAATSNKWVDVAAPRLESGALAFAGENSRVCQIVGVDPTKEDELTGLKAKLSGGSYWENGKPGAILADSLAGKLGVGIGDTVYLMGQGYHGHPAYGLYEVVGTVKFGSPDLNMRLMYLPIEQAQMLHGAEGRLTSLALNLNDSDVATQVAEDVREKLAEGDYEILDWKEMMPELVQQIESDKAGNILTMGVLYMIITFGLFGTVLMMTAERKYEFGVLTAIGMKKRKLASVITLETILIGILGVIAGALASMPMVLYFEKNPIYLGDEMAKTYERFGIEPVIPMGFDWSIFLNQGLIILVVTILLSLYPVYNIYKLNPVQAMRV